MRQVLVCITDRHDGILLWLAAAICIVGVYGCASVASHAGRSSGPARRQWSLVAILAAGCTAWATHMTGLLAFEPGMSSAFDPVLMVLSLAVGTVGIGAGVGFGVGSRIRWRRFLAGVILGCGVGSLHYLGELSYLVEGHSTWDWQLIAASMMGSLLLFGAAMIFFGERKRHFRIIGAPMLLLAIAVLHFFGMTATVLIPDPRVAFPAYAMPSHVVAPIVAVVSAALLGLAVFSYRIHLLRRNRARRAQQHLQELASVALEGLAVCHDGIIVAANASLERIVGAQSGILIGQQLSSLFPAAAIERMSPSQEYDADLLCNEGIVVPVRILWREVNLGGLPRLVLAVRDQRERLQTEAKIRALAFTDTLTGLPNRARFNDLVGTYAASLSISGSPFAILLIDLDQFKAVNDTLGHPAGDSLLRLVAARLSDLVDPLRDTVARLGGDEFAILSRSAVSEDCLQSLAFDVVRAMGRDFHIGYRSVGIGASVGVAIAPRDGNDADDLVRNADLALYDAKATGRNAFRLFNENLRAKVAERRSLEADLRAAIENDEFHVVYQPLLATRSSRIECAEALVRWQHPVRGTVSPADFIPVSEETGIVIDIGRLVLRRACEDAASWPPHLRVAVNLSPVQLRDPHFVNMVDEILTKTSFDPRRLEFEITEGVLVLDEERVTETLRRLKQRGISLAMDDFGTGYSSLNYLSRYPFDKIKIDRSFVCNLPHDDKAVAIVRAIVALAKATGTKTVVEGVETEEQFIFAQLEGCDFIQGYFIGKPSADVSKFASIVDQAAA